MIPVKFQEFVIQRIQYILEEISNINLRSKVFVTQEQSVSVPKRQLIALNSAFLPDKP